MPKASGIWSIEGLRSLVGSTSTAMKDDANPNPSSEAGGCSCRSFSRVTAVKLVSEYGLAKAHLVVLRMKLRRATEQINLLERKLEQDVNNNTEDSKLWHRLDSKVTSAKTLCDQLTEGLQKLTSQTKQDEEDKKFFEEILGKNSKSLDEINFLLHDLSTKLECAKQNNISGKEEMLQIKQGNEGMDRSCKEQPHSNCTMIKKSFCDQLTESLQQLTSQTEQAEEDKKFFEEIVGKNSKSLDEFNLLLHDLSRKLECANQNNISGKEEMLQIKQGNEGTDRSCKEQLYSNVEGDKKFFEEVLGKNSSDELNWLLNLSTTMECAKQKMVSEKLFKEQASVKSNPEGVGCQNMGDWAKPQQAVVRIQQDNGHKESMLWSYNKEELQRNQFAEHKLLKAPNTKRLFHSTTRIDMAKKREMPISNSMDNSNPGNTATIVLDRDDLLASRRSFRKGIRKVRAWCRAKSKPVDLSAYFGSGAEVFTTPEEGTFHLTFEYKKRRITLFLSGQDLYIRGWETERFGKFEMKLSDSATRFMHDLACTVLKIGENYHDLVAHGDISVVRTGPLAMMDAFEILHKNNSVSNAVMDAIAIFAVNTSEAVRNEEIFEHVSKAFNCSCNFVLGKHLALLVRKYKNYSKGYLQCLHRIIKEEPVHSILNNLSGGNIRTVQDLRRMIKVPLRTAYDCGIFKHPKPKPAVWSPPYPDGKYWVDEEEEEEEEKEDDEEQEKEEEDEDEDEDEDEEEEDGKFKHLKPQATVWSPLYTDGKYWVGDEDEEGKKEEEEEEKKEDEEVEEKAEDEKEEDEEKGEEEEEDVRDRSNNIFPVLKMASIPVLKMASSLSRFTEAASPIGIRHTGEYGLLATSSTCHRGTIRKTLAFGTRSVMMKAAELKSGHSFTYSICKNGLRSSRFLRWLL